MWFRNSHCRKVTPLNALSRRHQRPSRPNSGRIAHSGVAWWFVVVWSCALVWSVQEHGHVLVRGQFATNPLTLNATNALILNGVVSGDQSGFSVSGVGDVNGDNVSDFVVGAPNADALGRDNVGQAFLLFGRNASNAWTPNPFELSTLDGTNGVTLSGLVIDDRIGRSVSGVNDVNGDGINDVLIGSQFSDEAYLVFGVNGTWPAVVNLTQGAFNVVTIVGHMDDETGYSVSGAGDVNDDGMHDIAIGTRLADTPGGIGAGRVDVLYGRSSGSPWPAVVHLATYVNSSTGLSVPGDVDNGRCGTAVSGVGDVNGDGVDDVALSCPSADPGSVDQAGIVAVVFGSSSTLPTEITPSQLNGTNGFVVNGHRAVDQIGCALSRVGDVNGDGLNDFAIGAYLADANALFNSGEMYVLFGRNGSVSAWPAEVNVSSVDGSDGFVLAGSEDSDYVGHSVSAAGDVNRDGIDDVLVGADLAGASNRGLAFVLYGRAVWPARQRTSDLDGSMSNTFQGGADDDRCGYGVSHVGDVNGDGRGDLAIGCPLANPGAIAYAGQTVIVFGPLFTAPTTATPTTSPTTTSPTTPLPTPAPTTVSPTSAPTTTSPTTSSPTTSSPTTAPTTTVPTTTAPTTSPTTASPTAAPTTTAPTMTSTTTSPTPSTCATQGAFVPPGATCVNGVLVTTANTTAPAGTAVTVTTSVTVTGGASFEQPSGSTLVFVAGASGGGSTSIVVQDGGCATIGGDAVVSFEADPSNGGADSTTGTLVLVTADCVMGAFGSVSATASFEGDECVAIDDDGEQVASGSSISVSFGVSNTCANKSGGLSTGVLGGIIGGAVVVVLVVIAVAIWQNRKRMKKREAVLAGIQMHQ